ncbi:MAG: fumarylacetoacetate hydrolase family protein [Vicinamibacterales bacterium]
MRAAVRLSVMPVLLMLATTTTDSQVTGRPVTRYVRYAHEGRTAYGILDGDAIRELAGDLFSSPTPTGRTIRRSAVRLLAPCEPSKVLAVGLNYKSHLGQSPAPTEPPLFSKLPTSIIGPGEEIVFPRGATDVHYEGELVIVIGRTASKVPLAEAAAYVFGVTAGNDVAERAFQRRDIQWLRSKSSDTFGPLGPAIVQGLNYNDLLLQTRLNGEVVQTQRTKDLIFNVEEIVSYTSYYVTLFPGDVIYTGTPGATKAMKPGDVVEVEIEGIGVLTNRVAKIGTN